jgi:hypothetical protein
MALDTVLSGVASSVGVMSSGGAAVPAHDVPAEMRQALVEVVALAKHRGGTETGVGAGLGDPGRRDRAGPGDHPWMQARLRLSGRRARAHVENAALVDPEDGYCEGTRGEEPPLVTVTATVEQLAWISDLAEGGVVPPAWHQPVTGGAGAGRAAAPPRLRLVVLDPAGTVLEMRSPTRLATGAQRRDLVVREAVPRKREVPPGGPACSAPTACATRTTCSISVAAAAPCWTTWSIARPPPSIARTDPPLCAVPRRFALLALHVRARGVPGARGR